MDIERILQWIIIGVVALIGISILGFLLDIAAGLLGFGLKILLIVLVAVLVLRFIKGFSSSGASS